MSRALLLLVVLAFLGGLLVFFSKSGDRDEAVRVEPPVSVSSPSLEITGVEPSPSEPTPKSFVAKSGEQRVEVRSEEQIEAPDLGDCVVLGRVVDSAGAPLVGVEVRLSMVGVAARSRGASTRKSRPEPSVFSVGTDTGGRFRIEASTPPSGRSWLDIEPDPFHDSVRFVFDSDDPEALPELIAGERDLGEIRLVSTGMIWGRVQSAEGTPLGGMRVGIGPAPSLTFNKADVQTAVDGTYTIPHAPVGTYGVRAYGEGFLTRFQSPLSVEAGRRVGPFDIVLDPAPFITGTVVDPFGRVLGGARIEAWAASGDGSANARSGDDGRFTLYLPQEDVFALTARLEGYSTWDTRDQHPKVIESGTRDLSIVLSAIPKLRIEVVDAASGDPIERFGLAILEDNGSKAKRTFQVERRRPRLEDHPGGLAEVTARSGVDLYLIAARGYLMAEGDVDFEPGEHPRQKIALRRGASLTGRVLTQDTPVLGAQVQAERGLLRRSSDGSPPKEIFRALSSSPIRGSTDKDGRFRLEGLEKGSYRVTIQGPGGDALTRMVEGLVLGQEFALGDLVLVSGASARGIVLTPPGVDPGGLKVYLDDWRKDVSTRTDPEGRFGFTGLVPGPHSFSLEGRNGELEDMRAETFEFAAGEDKEITLDATEQGVCEVILHVDLGALSAQGVQVDLLNPDDPRERTTLGKCDEEGRVKGWVRAWGAATVRLWLPGPRQFVCNQAPLNLEVGQRIERTLHPGMAQLRLRLPLGMSLPTKGRASIELTPRSNDSIGHVVRLSFQDSKLTPNSLARVDQDLIEVDALPTGAFTLEFQLFDDTPENEAGESEIPVRPNQGSPYFRVSRDILLTSGESLDIAL